MWPIFLCLAFLTASLLSRPSFYHDPVSGSVLPSHEALRPVTPGDVEPDDILIVTHNESPLFSEKLGNLLKAVNAYHAGVTFRNVRTNQNFTTDFIAVPSVLESMFPKLTPSQTTPPTYTIEWIDYGLTRLRPWVNATYWTLMEPVYKITGSQFLTFVNDWIPKYNETVRWYKLMKTVLVSGPNQTSGKVVMEGFNCFDYMEWTLGVLKHLGATKIPTAPESFKVDKTYLIVDQMPTQLDFEANKEEIIEFYLGLEAVWNKTVSGGEEPTFEKILQAVVGVLSKGYIYHWEEKYWRLSVVDPFAVFVYDFWQLP